MQTRVITLKYNEGVQGFPEDALRKATFGREVLDVREHFFVYGNVPHLTVVLMLGDVPGDAPYAGWRRDGQAQDPAETLTDAQKAVYGALKQWRNETAKSEGRPAYAIARNVQLSELVRQAPKSLSALKEVKGLGEHFVEQYGKDVLKLMEETGVESRG